MAVIETKITKICGGLEGAEGPVFDTNGNFYAVSPFHADEKSSEDEFIDGASGCLNKIDVNTGEEEIVCTPLVDGYGGRPAGCQSDKENNIWIADMRLGILKYSPKDGCKQISKVDSNGDAMQACNDLVFDKKGNLWITAPGTAIAPAPEDREIIFKEPLGVLYCLENGKQVPVKVENEKFRFCNGIAVQDDLLLVAETMTQSIFAFDIISPGKLTNRRVWAKLIKGEYNNPLDVGGPDGMDFDIQGRLLVAHHGGGYIEVFSPDGKLESRIKCPFKQASNVHFLPKSKTCFITEHDTDALWKFEWECEGMPMFCDT